MKHTSPREPHERRSYNPAIGGYLQPPHLQGGIPEPPHISSSRIRLNYDDETISRLSQLYTDVDYIVEIIETSPPEIKLTLAMMLGIQIDLSEYPQEVHPMIRFSTPFLTEGNIELISQALGCADLMPAINIYRSCPPEQALLALAVASIIKAGNEA